MPDIQRFTTKDLLLSVSLNCDSSRIKVNDYEPFIDALCGDREYQKEAIRIAVRYLAGGEYHNVQDLAEKNYRFNSKLQEKYSSVDDFKSALQLPGKLSCSIDHATGTGKSYVMYGIARIMLAQGLVDQVLVLCPSITIEKGLTEKFIQLSGDSALKTLLPDYSVILNPQVTNASSTIKKGDICIENIHATHINTKSAIEDSLTNKGSRTLVLNDEAHHLMNPSDKDLKKWKEFLLDEKYGFNYIVNFSGTCYIGDDYFTDVVHRFSIRDAIEEKFIKSIRYVAEDSSGSQYEKFQKIYDNHVENKTVKYRQVKPLTILVTKDISRCEKLKDDLIDFLAEKEGLPPEIVGQKVLIVTSHRLHKKNLEILKLVDTPENPVEWITSVSMLSEGWDVKNVFQIVPHEERAFNSKLLIAQVLGRGLRIPPVYAGTQPVVTVFNHDKWSSGIQHLVDEVLEIEKRIYSYPVQKERDYHFNLHKLKLVHEPEQVDFIQDDEYNLLSKNYINYSSQQKEGEKLTQYKKALTGAVEEKITLVQFELFPIEEIVQDIYVKLYLFDMDLGTNYASTFTRIKIEEIIRNSLSRINDSNDWLSKENRDNTFAAFGVINRSGSKRIQIKINYESASVFSTKGMERHSIGVGSLRREETIFYDDDSLVLSQEEDVSCLQELIEDETLPRSSLNPISNKYFFKTPVNMVFSSYDPERKFIRLLVSEQNSSHLDSWVKSPDTGFYSIEYNWKKGTHPKQGKFNPDFILKQGNKIIIVETKMDDDDSDENKAKFKYAKEYFSQLNNFQTDYEYYFKFLSPNSYDLFFRSLREGSIESFISDLESQLM